MKVSKVCKRLLVCVMMVFVLGALSGCGKMTAEEVIKKYTEKSASIDNCEATMKMNMEMGQDGVEETYKVAVDSEIKMMTTPEYKAYVSMKMDMGSLGSYDMDTYIMKDGEEYYTYMYSAGQWMKQAMDADSIDEELNNYKNQVNTDVYIKNMKDFKLAGEETVEGKETYKIDGTISGEALQEVLEQSEVSDFAGVDTDSVDLSTLGSLTVSVWIDKKEFVPVKVYMDMTQMMSTMMEGQGLGVTVPVCTIEFLYTGFGTVTDITLPEEAKNAVSLDDAMNDVDTDVDYDSGEELEADDDSQDDETYELDENNTEDEADGANEAE